MNLLAGLQAANAGSTLLNAVRQAAAGDPAALEFLKRDGLYQALEVFGAMHGRPGEGGFAREVVEEGKRLLGSMRIIEGEYRELEPEAPWNGFVRRIVNAKFGGNLILGQPGSGKTFMTFRLAQLNARLTDHRVETTNAYPGDLPTGVYVIGLEELHRRITVLNEAKRRADEFLSGRMIDDTTKAQAEAMVAHAVAAFTGRNIILDEAASVIGKMPQDQIRQDVDAVIKQGRHLRWNLYFISQQARDIPEHFFGIANTWVKNPTGMESTTDRESLKWIWRRGKAAFDEVRSQHWASQWPDPRMWAYVESPAGVGGSSVGYRGMVPVGEPVTGREE